MTGSDLSDFSDFFPALKKGLVRHLVENAVRTDGPFTLASGAISDWYLDARQTTYSGDGAVLVARCVLEVMSPHATAVGGMTMGADPIAVATATIAALDDRALKAFSVRKEAKDHGTGGRLVGPLDHTDRVVVVEDTTTTGKSMVAAVEAIRAEGIGVVQAISIVDRSDGVAGRVMGDYDVPFLSIVVPADLGVS
ncbi:MAG: orotate phosphoribosyltransferase [Acidimicrobiia bacterium]|nr:orotate phosphoribosyltransferase [Acidimicrobiia bacterium]